MAFGYRQQRVRTVSEGIYCNRKKNFQKEKARPNLASEVEFGIALYGSA